MYLWDGVLLLTFLNLAGPNMWWWLLFYWFVVQCQLRGFVIPSQNLDLVLVLTCWLHIIWTLVLVYWYSSQLHILAKIRSLILIFLFRCNCCISGQGSSLIICVGILTGYTEMLYNMLSRLSGRWLDEFDLLRLCFYTFILHVSLVMIT